MTLIKTGPSLTVDGIVVKNGKILLIRRGKDPFRGAYALPGGFVEYGETVEGAIVREIKEETGLETDVSFLLGVYSDPLRDPRGHTVTVVFVMDFVRGELHPGDDAIDAGWFDLDQLPELAFDHYQIINDYRKRMT